MNFTDIHLKYTYESGKDDLLWDFYIPVLSYAKRYDRISGFFSSTSLAIAARGMAGLIANGGIMRLITCQKLSKEDVDVFSKPSDDSIALITEAFQKDIDAVTDAFEFSHLAALGWMLTQGRLQVKFALVSEKAGNVEEEISKKSIMHQKVGIMYDEDFNSISFSGSNNESASGWLNNIEEFKVFKAWEPGQQQYYLNDQAKFTEFWKNTRPGVVVIDLPTAIRDKLIEISNDFDIEQISLQKYYTHHQHITKKRQELKLFFYQKNAVTEWEKSGYRLLLEMATGCGKTRTAIGCLKSIIAKGERPLLTIITCPQNTLSQQWKADIDSLDTGIAASVICDGTVSNWATQTHTEIQKLCAGLYQNLVIYTTHATCSSDKFIALMNSVPAKIMTFFIGDEVHGLGAPKTRKGLLESYEYRLGLSATPSRWFDEDGSKLIADYFNNKSFVFTIHDALTTINPLTGKPFLVNFNYHPHFVQLTDDELSEYKALSDKITKMSRIAAAGEVRKQTLEFLLFRRADLEKNAENKYAELEAILDEIGPRISNTIIFVSDEQIDHVLQILGARGIPAHRFTQGESTTPATKYGGVSERQYLIKKFIEGDYKILVAIKCLDEGIDIPSANRAIVMASSTNPREYVQRIGRVIRQAPGKYTADIYDLILHPDMSGYQDDEFANLEKKIFTKEMDRVKDLSLNALNNADVLNRVYKVMEGLL